MKRSDYEVIAQLRAFLIAEAPGLTKRELTSKAFEAFPGAVDLLLQGWKESWCWEQVRSARDSGQLPLFTYEQVIKERGTWDRELFIKAARKYDRAARQNAKLRDDLKVEYEAKFHEQMQLWDDADLNA